MSTASYLRALHDRESGIWDARHEESLRRRFPARAVTGEAMTLGVSNLTMGPFLTDLIYLRL